MGWIANENNTKVFRINFRENRKLHKLDFPTKEQARTHIELKKRQIEQDKDLRAAEAKLDQDLDRLDELTQQIIVAAFICAGLVRRKSVWQFVNRVNNPLTREEKAFIRKVKFKAKLRDFRELKSRFQN
jgi:HD superfamily phosphodiesterase